MRKELDKLAKATNRSRSFLVNEAIAGYVEREREIVVGIEKARRELKAGKGLSLKEAKAIVDRAIADAQPRRKA
jgi:predicted transcriptional regulator